MAVIGAKLGGTLGRGNPAAGMSRRGRSPSPEGAGGKARASRDSPLLYGVRATSVHSAETAAVTRPDCRGPGGRLPFGALADAHLFREKSCIAPPVAAVLCVLVLCSPW